MLPWQLLGTAEVPGNSVPLTLHQRGREFVIRIGAIALMSSEAHGSEEALAELACVRIAERDPARVLVGGLGMGFTLAAALGHLGPSARVMVAELVPAVLGWNRGPLAHLAGRPLEDARVSVWEGDVGLCLRADRAGFDAILLDVDDGPAGLTRSGNDALYSATGLRDAFAALHAGGILGVWSVAPDDGFTKRLEQAGFTVEAPVVRARRTKGGRHTVWLATKPATHARGKR